VANQLTEPIQFGKYTLFERIGHGGMAEVFKGRIQGPAGFERTFVVKRILPHLSDDQAFIKMFVEEAKLSARLNHPNIVHIFELGAVEGEYFISMEYIRGHDLSETMRAIWKTMGPPRPELVAFIGREVCRGLAYAHGLTDDAGRPLGMIHRDISPSNVMLSYEGAVKLLDFGIAKAMGDTAEATKGGTMKGKYAYMAPEQTDARNVDHRVDIFACGIVLHEVLTGRRLFKGQNDVQTIERVRRCEVPPPSMQNPAVPPELDAVVLKALARRPDDRWQSAGEMADALDDVVHAARFQPTHLAQLIYDLFPVEGGGTRPTAHSTHAHGITVTQGTGSGNSMRSFTVPPVSRTASGAAPGPIGFGNDAEPSLKPKSRFPATLAVLALLAGGGGAAWKFLGHQRSDARVGVSSDPNRRFYIHVKSTPDGANIYTDDGKRERLMGSTPVTLPIDLTGVSSVKLKLKKPGFEDYEQIVVDDTSLSISLTPVGGAPAPAPTPMPDAPSGGGAKEPGAGTTSTSSGTGSAATDSSSSRPHRHRPHKSSDSPAPKSDEPAGGEIE
jgi:serine/threonine protein kinase